MYLVLIMLEDFMKIYSPLVCSVTNNITILYIKTNKQTNKQKQQWQTAHIRDNHEKWYRSIGY